jgi:prepilin-type N-terminal cleavage/methylation domain-containing protein
MKIFYPAKDKTLSGADGLKKYRQNKGFTLIEVLIAVSIITISAIMVIPSWKSFSDNINISNTAKAIDSKVNLAKSYSVSSLNNANYGVRFETGKITLFKVNPYAVIEEYNLPATMEIYDISLNGGGADVAFSRLTGTTDNYGSVKIRRIADASRWKQIFINSQGQTGADIFGSSAGAPKKEDPAHNINARHIHFVLSAWSIQNYDTLRLEWTGAGVTAPFTKDVVMASYFNADKSSFDWQGTETVDSASQTLRIHTLSLDAGTTSLCIMRDRTQNNKSLNIYFLQSGTPRKIVNYTESGGTVNVTRDPVYVNDPILPQ